MDATSIAVEFGPNVHGPVYIVEGHVIGDEEFDTEEPNLFFDADDLGASFDIELPSSSVGTEDLGLSVDVVDPALSFDEEDLRLSVDEEDPTVSADEEDSTVSVDVIVFVDVEDPNPCRI